MSCAVPSTEQFNFGSFGVSDRSRLRLIVLRVLVLSLLLIQHTELVSRRLLIGAGLIVAGGVLIGVYAG